MEMDFSDTPSVRPSVRLSVRPSDDVLMAQIVTVDRTLLKPSQIVNQIFWALSWCEFFFRPTTPVTARGAEKSNFGPFLAFFVVFYFAAQIGTMGHNPSKIVPNHT